ncbi:MAG: polysaccharide biosynthesis/export family protein [Thermodesulfobacteriota bacterium]
MSRTSRGTHARRARAALLLSIVAAGCSAGASAPSRQPASAPTAGAPAVRSDALAAVAARPSAAPSADLTRLAELYEKRTEGSGVVDHPIGPGDLIEINVPAMEELRDRSVRVASDGNVTLPLLGTVRAEGLTETQLHEDLRRRLGHYMHKPQLSLLVKEYRSRQVGVLGAVARPGLQITRDGGDTILDMISEAGGLTDQASQRLLFIPAEQVDQNEARQLASAGLIVGDAAPGLYADGSPSSQLIKATSPIVIDLEKMSEGSQQMALSVPVRPGDTIIALGGGQVFVQGWVEKPGAYPITRGLTLLGALAAAGGASYPADKTSVRLLRDTQSGGREVLVANIEDVEQGKSDDVLLREGDIVEVEATGGKLAAYGVYHFFTNVMRMGFALSPF